MGKIWVEVGLVSARGIRRSSLFKLRWFAVGWIDPRNKYCTRFDASGGMNPVWNTKFAALVDASDKELHELELKVEVYSREPVFLTERLQGRATVVLKEFLEKRHLGKEGVTREEVEQIASYQLRKPSTSKPQGFVDISVRITEEGDDPRSYRPSDDGGSELADRDGDGDVTLSSGETSTRAHPKQHLPIVRQRRREISADAAPLSHKLALDGHRNPSPGAGYHPSPPEPALGLELGSSYQRPSAKTSPSPSPPPPPLPPSHIGLVSTFLPSSTTDTDTPLHSFREGNRAGSPEFVAGLGAGTLAAGAVIFGDDFLSGFNVPQRLQ